MMRISGTAVVSGILLLVLLKDARAQDVPRYRPAKPTVSPYLNLLRNDNGPLPIYYGLVRPQLNQQAFDNSMANTARSQNIAIQRLTTISGEGSTGPTGSASVFNNTSHFYPSKRQSARR